MATAKEQPEGLDEDMEDVLEDMTEILYDLPPEKLSKFRAFNHKFEKIVEKVQSRKEDECLCHLKKLTGVGRRQDSGILRKIFHTTTSFFHGTKKRETSQLKVCSSNVTHMSLSMDPEAVENTDPLLIALSDHCCCVKSLNLNSCNLTAEGLLALKELCVSSNN